MRSVHHGARSRKDDLGRFARQRLTADERDERRRRRHERQRQIKGSYVHREEIHGEFELIGDAALKRMLYLLGSSPQSILIAGEQRHAQQAEKAGHKVLWQVDSPVRDTDLMMGYVYRRPDLEGPLLDYDFPSLAQAAFVCERVQKAPNLRDYLVDLRLKVHVDAPVTFIVPLAHHELVRDHYTLFTEGTLLYNFVMAGWNCRDAVVKKTPRHLEVSLRRLDIPHIESSQIEDIAIYMPYNKRLYNYCTSELGETD